MQCKSFAIGWNNPKFSNMKIVIKSEKPLLPRKRKLDADEPNEPIQSKDVTYMEEESILVDRLVLAANSEYFKTLLDGKFKEGTSDVIDIDVLDEDRPYFKDLIRFFYFREFETKIDGIFRVLSLADRFNAEDAERECKDIISKHKFTTEDASNLLQEISAYEGSCKEVFKEILKHLRSIIVQNHTNLDDPETQESFLNLGWRGVVCVLSSQLTGVYSENTVFQLVKKWILRDPGNRLESAYYALHLVRYHTMSVEFLNSVVSENDIFKKINPEHVAELKGLVVEAIYYILVDEETKKIVTSIKTPFRQRSMTLRPNMFMEKGRYVKIKISLPVQKEKESRSERFVVHGYSLYFNCRVEEVVGKEKLSITLHIDQKETGIHSVNTHITTLHYKFYLKNLADKKYYSVGIVDHVWYANSGWGKTIDKPGPLHINPDDNIINIQAHVALGKSPIPDQVLPPLVDD